jgi:hypothetical protein
MIKYQKEKTMEKKIYILFSAVILLSLASDLGDVFVADTVKETKTVLSCGSFSELGSRDFKKVSDCLRSSAPGCQGVVASMSDTTKISLVKDKRYGCLLDITDVGINSATGESGVLNAQCSIAQMERYINIQKELKKEIDFLSVPIEATDYVCKVTQNEIVEKTLGQSIASLNSYEKGLTFERGDLHNSIVNKLKESEYKYAVPIENKYGAYVDIVKIVPKEGEEVVSIKKSGLIAMKTPDDEYDDYIGIWMLDKKTKKLYKNFGSFTNDCGDYSLWSKHLNLDLSHAFYQCAGNITPNPYQFIINGDNHGEIKDSSGKEIGTNSKISIDWSRDWDKAILDPRKPLPIIINRKKATIINEKIEW